MNENTKQTDTLAIPDPRALNGVKHGALSELVPSWEQEAFTAHRKAVRGSVGAGGYLQQQLADRAALALWRLERVARWEAQQMETDRRRFYDRMQTKDPYSGLIGQAGPLTARNLIGTLEALSELTGKEQAAFLNDTDAGAAYAEQQDQEAQAWGVMLEGSDPATVTAEQAEVMGIDLLAALQETWDVSADRVARALLGRKATRQEAQDVADWDWIVEPHKLAALVALGVSAAGGPDEWRSWLFRKHYEAAGKAGKVRALTERLPLLIRQELAQADEPDVRCLEKIARYEAHLERVLYRALHELATMQPTDPTPAAPGMQPDSLTALN